MGFEYRHPAGTRRAMGAAALAILTLTLGGCASQMSWPGSDPAPAAPPPTAAPLPASIPARDLVGRWGLAAFHKPEDRARTETAARGQCRQPYVIGAGARGGVIMHLADQAQPTELALKGGPDGKNYVGPAEEPAAGDRDREIVSFDGRVLVMRWVSQEIAGRYGTSVYVRCGPPGIPAAKR
jgi:hypothetical protein